MKILTTKDYGYCYGVKRAINTVNELLSEGINPLYCYGYIIHNEIINKSLEDRGVVFTENLDDIPLGSTLVIRAHGISDKLLKEISDKYNVVDMTCPKVKRIREIAKVTDKLIVFGDPNHPEVKGIVGSTNGEYIIIKNYNEALELTNNKNLEGYTLVSQTTANNEIFEKISKLLKASKIVTKVENTICATTFLRQNQVKELSKQCDCIIIVGGKNSSNSKRLYEIASENCDAILINSFSELPKDFIFRRETIGLSSGASTPAEAIEEVKINMVNESEVNQGVEVVTNSEEEEFLQAVEGKLNLVRRGKEVIGVITAINGSEIQIDIGSKHSGIIPTEEFENDSEPPKIGDEVKAVVVKVDDQEGTALLSKKKFENEKKYIRLQQVFDTAEVIPVKIEASVKGGLITSYSGVRIFIPASLASLSKKPALEEMVGTDQSIRVIEYEPKKRKVIGSIRSVLLDERKLQRAQLWDSLEAGQRKEGVITAVCDFGVFVNIGGADGLVHISDLSWIRPFPIADHFKVGQQVTAIVKSVNKETKKLSLTLKLPEENPWNIISEKYHVDDVIEVTVLRITQFGAFVSIIPGVDGLIHISQISNKKINKVSDVLSIGQVVNAKIISIELKEKKISLSMSALIEDDGEEQEETVESVETSEPEQNVEVEEVAKAEETVENVETAEVEETKQPETEEVKEPEAVAEEAAEKPSEE